MYFIGYDLGSSTIKAALVEADSQQVVAMVQYPDREMDIIARQPGWAEQDPELWWLNICMATRRLMTEAAISAADVGAIGIGYQMHGLVLIDRDRVVLRPAIIWCDSRAVAVGQQAFHDLGQAYCLQQLLNSPGNFTASKLKWIKDNEPAIYDRTWRVLLPGDFIAMKCTGQVQTTISGLSEGILWNFQERQIDQQVLDYFGIDAQLIPTPVPTFGAQGRLTAAAAKDLGLEAGTSFSYRAGDQPNNALALNVLRPGEVAATSGTSGVVYGIVDQAIYDPTSRVNAFAHVNYADNFDRIGILLCLNGAGIEYAWMRKQIARSEHAYTDMERMARSVPVGADGLCLLPFGNGAERILDNTNLNAHLFNLDFNRHTRAHLYRAGLEGVAFSFVYGMNILRDIGLNVDVIRVGNDNMFQSAVFSGSIATLMNCEIDVVNTTGAVGAALGAGFGVGYYSSLEEAVQNVRPSAVYHPENDRSQYERAYAYWHARLHRLLDETTAPPASVPQQKKQGAHLRKAVQLEGQLQHTQRLLQQIQTFLTEQPSEGLEKQQQALLRQVGQQLATLGKVHLNDNLFEEHHEFRHKLLLLYPSLSRQEVKLCVLSKLKWTSKEMAAYLNLSVRGVETSRYRLRRKLNIPKGVGLGNFLRTV